MWLVETNEKFRQIVKEKGLTLKQAGKEVYVTEDTAKSWSSGRRKMPLVSLELLSNKLNILFKKNDYLVDKVSEKD